MLGAFLNKANHIEVKETQTPEPNKGEVRVKLSKVGICGSDVYLFLGHRIIPNPSIIYNHPFDFQRVIQLIAAKIINPIFVISSCEPLQNLQSALEKAAIGEQSKIIISI